MQYNAILPPLLPLLLTLSGCLEPPPFLGSPQTDMPDLGTQKDKTSSCSILPKTCEQIPGGVTCGHHTIDDGCGESITLYCGLCDFSTQRTNPHPAGLSVKFGSHLLMYGEHLLVSAPEELIGDDFKRRGKIHRLSRNQVDYWEEKNEVGAKSIPCPGQYENAGFGTQVIIVGEDLLTNAPGYKRDNVENSGALFHYSMSEAKISSPITLTDNTPNLRFGQFLAKQEDTVYVGAPGYIKENEVGAVLLYDEENLKAASDLTPIQTIVSPIQEGVNSDFGSHFAVYSDILAVGAPAAQGKDGISSVPNAGAVFLYTRGKNNAWNFQSRIDPAIAHEGARFGARVFLSKTQLFIQEPSQSDSGLPKQAFGRLHVYDIRNSIGGDTIFALKQTLSGHKIAQDLGESALLTRGDLFGDAIWVTNNLLIVGAPYTEEDDNLKKPGGIYVFEKLSGKPWKYAKKLTPYKDALEKTRFGKTFLYHDGLFIVGAPLRQNKGQIIIYDWPQFVRSTPP